MYHQSKPHNDDDDDDFTLSSRSSKLASIFSEDSPSKSTKDLKYVAPKQPQKTSPTPDMQQHTSPQNGSTKGESNSAILYATAAELYSHKKGTPITEGRVMCCIIRKSNNVHFVLLVYRTKKNVIAQANVRFNFNMLVQKNNYVSFVDDVGMQWSLYIDGIKSQEFLTQIGICRALSGFSSQTPPSVVTQHLSEGDGSYLLQKSDSPLVTYCSWQVQNYKRGKQIGELREGVEVHLEKTTWESGLVNCRKNQHVLVFVPNIQIYETDKSSLIVYEVTIENPRKEKTPAGEMENKINSPINSGLQDDAKAENEASSKAALISRMARVGQPLLPPTPSRRAVSQPLAPTDSESEEDHHQRRYHHGNDSHAHSSTSSSVEEITVGASAQHRKTSDNESNFSDTCIGRGGPSPLRYPPYVPQGPGGAAVIAYHPFPFQQNQHPHQQQNESTSKSSDPLLSLLFSETRSQNTDLRVALSQLTQKVDMVYAKVNAIETHPQRFRSPGQVNSSLGVTGSAQFDPHDLLQQISAMVDQIEKYKKTMEESERKTNELTKDYTQVLKKNQTLLEEKAELVALKGESGESQKESKIHLQELLAVQEKRIRVETELQAAKMEIENLQNDLEQTKKNYSTLKGEMELLQKTSHLEQSQKKESEDRAHVVRQMNEEIDRLRNDLTEMRENEHSWRQTTKGSEEEVKDAKNRLSEALQQNEKLRQEVEGAERVKAELERQLVEYQNAVQGKEDLERKLVEYQNVVQGKEELERKLVEYQDAVQGKEDLERRLNEYQDAVEAKQDLESKMVQYQEAVEANQDLEKRLREYQEAVKGKEDLERKLVDYQNTVEANQDLERKLVEYQEAVRGKEDLERKLVEYQEAVRGKEDLERKLVEYQEAVRGKEDLERKLVEYQEAVKGKEDLERKLVDYQNTVEANQDLERKLAEYQNEREQLLTKLEETEKAKITLERKLEKVEVMKDEEKEREKLLKKVEDAERVITLLEERLKEVEAMKAGVRVEEKEKEESVRKGMEEQHRQVVEDLKKALQVTQKRLASVEEDSAKKIAALKEKVKTRTAQLEEAKAEGGDSPRPQTEAVVKQVMNATYRRLKVAFREGETYDKGTILHHGLAAIRETTLLFLARRKEVEGDPNPPRLSPATAGGKELTAAVHVAPTSPEPPGSQSGWREPPVNDIGSRATCGSPMPPPEPIREVPTVFADSHVGVASTARGGGVSQGTHNPEPKSEDEEDWRPLPPPPPLFSDTDDDDDWLS